MALAAELSTQLHQFETTVPPQIKDPILKAKDDLAASFDSSMVIKAGETLPAFSLPDATGREISSSTLLATSPLLITFYRGGWCPYCNITLAALQKHVAEYKAKGVNFIAISPELPDVSLSTSEKLQLQFPVLSDVGLSYARKLGIVFKQDEAVREPFATVGIDLNMRNGDDSFELPVPVTLLVDTHGIVRNVFFDADFTKRLEPSTALEWIDTLNN